MYEDDDEKGKRSDNGKRDLRGLRVYSDTSCIYWDAAGVVHGGRAI